jgi:predicted lipoprotein with Yx(FWY)xxD motif
MFHLRQRASRPCLIACLMCGSVLLVAGCAGAATTSAGSSGSVTSGATAATGSSLGSTVGSTVPGSTPAGVAIVATTTGALGTYLVDGTGQTLYMYDADPEGTSDCYDACATSWPPLVTSAAPTAGNGVDLKRLSTSTRTDGSTQVLYGGHPLYLYGMDAAPGQTNGQASGGVWWVVGVDGQPIKPAAANPSSTPAAQSSSPAAEPAPAGAGGGY